jgi:hypothetical protein
MATRSASVSVTVSGTKLSFGLSLSKDGVGSPWAVRYPAAFPKRCLRQSSWPTLQFVVLERTWWERNPGLGGRRWCEDGWMRPGGGQGRHSSARATAPRRLGVMGELVGARVGARPAEDWGSSAGRAGTRRARAFPRAVRKVQASFLKSRLRTARLAGVVSVLGWAGKSMAWSSL